MYLRMRLRKLLRIILRRLYEYETSKYGSQEATNSSKVTATYYPIVSNSHPYVVATDALAIKYGGYDKIPDSEWPEFGQFAVLVKTDAFKTIGKIPDEWTEKKKITGLIVNEIDPLGSEEMNLIRESFPSIKFGQVLILEQGRTPSSTAASFGMMGGGGILAAFGVLLLFRRKE